MTTSPVVGQTYDAPATQATQVPASGGSVINVSTTVSVLLSSKQAVSTDDPTTVTLQPGGSLPWPAQVACWVLGIGGDGSVYVTPIQLPYSPGALGGQPVAITSSIPLTEALATAGAGVQEAQTALINTGNEAGAVTVVNATANVALRVWSCFLQYADSANPPGYEGILASVYSSGSGVNVHAIGVEPGGLMTYGPRGMLLPVGEGIVVLTGGNPCCGLLTFSEG